ncbi:origin recognition complex subunit 2 [Anthonomus grandis grandis]|uniref:origin recognition complex subunit 2 n=1 Tax=Anthonomus grandis grandis TaxID=2921223 RepID=UPI0021660745|nr:origin recognition complex subunit 2 [Anthonomus grandis grandis]
MATGNEELPVRRTRREKKPSLKAMESLYATKLKSGGFVASVSSSDEEQFMFSDDEEDYDSPEKPKLLHEDEMVKGDEMFTFQKRKDRASLALKVSEMQKTPHVVRSKIKSKLKMVFEDSGSEYEVSEEESSESDSSDNVSEKSEQEEHEKPKKNKLKANIKFDDAKAKVSTRGRKIKQNSKYTIDTDEYFANSALAKIKTSNNTLDKLQTPRLPQYELQKLLLNKRFSKEHIKGIDALSAANKQQFKKWLYVLHQNFSILLYGLGSKKSILSIFQEEYLQDHPVIVINGFFPTLSIKNIIDSFIEDLFELDENPSNLNQAVDLIIQEAQNCSDTYFYLLINNIEAIRGAKAQTVLATLASVPNICLIATIDHINAPLIWDHTKLSKFNFTWWDVTSYLTYQHETECEMSSMTQQNSSLALSSLRNVFLSLTQNSKAIYSKIGKYQIENSGQYYQGMAFKELYKACRESFIVSSDLALRAQLSEFIDHKMIKTKRSMEDGTEYLVIPLANNLLQKFMDEIS